MAVTYNKVKSDVDPYQLQFDVNASTDIAPVCTEITVDEGDQLTLVFNTSLSTEEESALDALILLHTPVEEHFSVTKLPFSRHLDGKLAVHSSAKPEPDGHTTYAQWTGAGDDLNLSEEESIGAGELLSFNMAYDESGAHTTHKDIKFDPRHGRVWIHEAYLKFENGGVADYLDADVIAPATPLQQVQDLDYIVEDGWLKYAPPGSPSGGTHGLAGSPVLVPRSFAHDGDWDYDGTSLTPNFAGNGEYKITTIERPIHRYFGKIPLRGTSATYFTMSSEETAELPVDLGYFIRVCVRNESNSNWNLSIIMEIYRERTIVP